MNHELAKELKDAGFPQNYGDGAFRFKDGSFGHGPTRHTFYHPTLEELIEACGDKFKCLKKLDYGSGWIAESTNCKEAGFSPEKAVTRLWLAQNKKV